MIKWFWFVFAVLGCADIVFLTPAWGQLKHVNPNAIGDYQMAKGFGGGIAAADYDDDGDIDVFAPTAPGVADQLYRNLGNGQFEEIAADVGLANTQLGRVALWLDYDADHRLDLLVAGDCYNINCDNIETFLHLYRQTATGTFVDVTASAGLVDPGHTTEQHRSGIAAGDFNGDGFLDFVTGFWEGTFHLYLNQGNGSFTDTSAASGFDATVLGHWQPVVLDFNDDGLPDIYSAIDFTENRLWINQGSTGGIPTFTEQAAAAKADNAMNDMGVAIGDFDDDGDPDLYVTNIFGEGEYNILLRNDSSSGNLLFTEISLEVGVRDGGWGWGATFVDIDNNGYLDLAETNGWRVSRKWRQPPRLFIHQGDNPITFVDRAAEFGLTDTSWGSALLAFDYDRDGDLDLMETISDGPLALYENHLDISPDDSRYLVIRPRTGGRNVRAIGAKVAVHVGTRTMTRWITAGTSYLGQEPAEAFFGLGAATMAEQVRISWPDGDETVLKNVPAGQVQTVVKELPLEGISVPDDIFLGPGTVTTAEQIPDFQSNSSDSKPKSVPTLSVPLLSGLLVLLLMIALGNIHRT